MNNRPIKKIVLLLLIAFSLTVFAISLHHHHKSISLPICSLCKVKTAISGAITKIDVDSGPVIACLNLVSISIFLFLSGMLSNKHVVFIDSQVTDTYPNKASPFSF